MITSNANRGKIIASNNDNPFGLPGELVVTIPAAPPFYSLYADGRYSRKTYVKDEEATLIAYPPGAVVILYYTYPTLRAASLIRSVPGSASLPGLSRNVRLLFSVHASKVDKLKRAASYLNAHTGGAFGFDDAFYLRLYFLIKERGKLNYLSLRRLSETERERTA